MVFCESVSADAEYRSCSLASGYWIFDSSDRCAARVIS